MTPTPFLMKGECSPEVAETPKPDLHATPRSAHVPDRSPSSSSNVTGHVWSLSQDADGCRAVQDAIVLAGTEAARILLAMELSGHILEALQCPHANHVLRKFITTMAPPSIQFLIDELVHEGEEAIAETAKHRYGCRILEALIKTCEMHQLSGMVEHLLPHVVALSTRMYGNFVVQRLLEHGSDAQRFHICQALRTDVATIASNFYGSIVVGAALKHGTHEHRVNLSRDIIRVNGLLSTIARFRHGQIVKEQILVVLETSEQELASMYPEGDSASVEFKPSKVTRASNSARCKQGKPQASKSAFPMQG